MGHYFESDHEHPISRDALREAERAVQLDVMETWFRARYEDPANRTPYESAEGGYVYIWGGPYDAREELESEFGDIIDEEVIEEAVEILEHDGLVEWSPTPKDSDYDDYVFDSIVGITEYHKNFVGAIQDIEALAKVQLEGAAALHLRRLLFVNVITALETYLSDAFISTVGKKPGFMRRFIESNPDFKSQKVSMADLYKAVETIEAKARSYLVDVVWHNIERIRPMYKDTFGITFPEDLKTIFRAIITRHDIVHRNGKTKEGDDIKMEPADLAALIVGVETFVEHVDQQVSKLDEPSDSPDLSAPSDF
jgi:hypothetical protein